MKKIQKLCHVVNRGNYMLNISEKWSVCPGMVVGTFAFSSKAGVGKKF